MDEIANGFAMQCQRSSSFSSSSSADEEFYDAEAADPTEAEKSTEGTYRFSSHGSTCSNSTLESTSKCVGDVDITCHESRKSLNTLQNMQAVHGEAEECHVEMQSCHLELLIFHNKIIIKIMQPDLVKTSGTCEFHELCLTYRLPNEDHWQMVVLQAIGAHIEGHLYQLRPAACYEISVQCKKDQRGTVEKLNLLRTTRISGPPDKPTVQLTPIENVVVLDWEPPSSIVEGIQITGYSITVFRVNPLLSNPLLQVEKQYVTSGVHFLYLSITPGQSYKFQIHALSGALISEAGEVDMLRLKHQVLQDSSKLPSLGRPVFQVKLSKKDLPAAQFPIWEMGHPFQGYRKRKECVVLIIGAIGAGKTTLINTLINYVLGVEFKDRFRFKLVSEIHNTDPSCIQTQHISAYILHHRDGFRIPYTLTIIDTPGFGEADGTEKNKEIARDLYDFLRSDVNLVDHIDVVGFVAPASLPRLTPTQGYIFDYILSLFGKDIADNIFLLLTFADGKPSQILAAIGAANIQHQGHFKFNNSAVFDDIGSNADLGQLNEIAGTRITDNWKSDVFDEIFWNFGMENFKFFMNEIGMVTPKCLKLIRDALEQRGNVDFYPEEKHRQVGLELGESFRQLLKLETIYQFGFDHQIEGYFGHILINLAHNCLVRITSHHRLVIEQFLVFW